MTENMDHAAVSAAIREAARYDYLADPSLTGSDLAARYGRSGSWGRRRIVEARQMRGTDMTVKEQLTPRRAP